MKNPEFADIKIDQRYDSVNDYVLVRVLQRDSINRIDIDIDKRDRGRDWFIINIDEIKHRMAYIK